MIMFVFKCAARYVCLVALFLASFLAIHAMASLVVALLSYLDFVDILRSGFVVFSGFVTIGLAIAVWLSYDDHVEHKKYNLETTGVMIRR
jgi:ABC-type uncharacterized transport system permease subunit